MKTRCMRLDLESLAERLLCVLVRPTATASRPRLYQSVVTSGSNKIASRQVCSASANRPWAMSE